MGNFLISRGVSGLIVCYYYREVGVLSVSIIINELTALGYGKCVKMKLK